MRLVGNHHERPHAALLDLAVARQAARFLVHETLALAVDVDVVVAHGVGDIADGRIGRHRAYAGAGRRVAVHVPEVSADLLRHLHAVAHVVGAAAYKRVGAAQRHPVVRHHFGIRGETAARKHDALLGLHVLVAGNEAVHFLRLVVVDELGGAHFVHDLDAQLFGGVAQGDPQRGHAADAVHVVRLDLVASGDAGKLGCRCGCGLQVVAQLVGQPFHIAAYALGPCAHPVFGNLVSCVELRLVGDGAFHVFGDHQHVAGYARGAARQLLGRHFQAEDVLDARVLRRDGGRQPGGAQPYDHHVGFDIPRLGQVAVRPRAAAPAASDESRRCDACRCKGASHQEAATRYPLVSLAFPRAHTFLLLFGLIEAAAADPIPMSPPYQAPPRERKRRWGMG